MHDTTTFRHERQARVTNSFATTINVIGTPSVVIQQNIYANQLSRYEYPRKQQRIGLVQE